MAGKVWETYQHSFVSPASLWSAAKDNDVESLARLLDEGDDIDLRDLRGYAPLMLAAWADNDEAFDFLLAQNANPNTSDLAGNTVLMSVAAKGQLRKVEALIAAGADPTRKNHEGRDARSFAAEFARSAVVELLDDLVERNRALQDASGF